MEIYLKGKRLLLDPKRSIGKGGEADIYDIGQELAAKIFKTPDHPDFTGMPDEQKAARKRITEHQRKLKEFPRTLPDRVITPVDLIIDGKGSVAGYTMRLIRPGDVLLRYGEYQFRNNIPDEEMGKILLDMHPTIETLHKREIVIGDFNDLNVLVNTGKAYFIDTDSYQFDNWFAQMFTARFVDPLLCDPQAKEILLKLPHNEMSDWYAYAVMVMQSYLLVDPYGGVYKPKSKSEYLTPIKRMRNRVTVFNQDVRYPKYARSFGLLNDDLLEQFHQVFEKDKREIFPAKLIENLHWTKCLKCGAIHARTICPVCAVPGQVKETVKVRGKVTATEIFKTKGGILFAAWQDNKLLWLYNENDRFYREKETEILEGKPLYDLRYRLRGKETLIARGGEVITFDGNRYRDKINVDTYGYLPVFDANADHRYFLRDGNIERDNDYGNGRIKLGGALAGQTLFWVGPKFGFGFYRVGQLSINFVFSARFPMLNDSIKIPPIRGQLLDSTCFFTDELCWFLLTVSENGKIIDRCHLINQKGEVKASFSAEKGSVDWLQNIRGKLAFGNALFSTTDEGIVKIGIENGNILRQNEFPDTEPFVNTHAHLFPGLSGIHAVNRKNIVLLKLN